MVKKFNNDLIGVNICVLIFGIPAIWAIGQVFREPFIWSEIFRILIVSLLLVNIPQIFRHFRTRKLR